MKTGDSHRLVNTVFLARGLASSQSERLKDMKSKKTNCLSKCRYLLDVRIFFNRLVGL